MSKRQGLSFLIALQFCLTSTPAPAGFTDAIKDYLNVESVKDSYPIIREHLAEDRYYQLKDNPKVSDVEKRKAYEDFTNERIRNLDLQNQRETAYAEHQKHREDFLGFFSQMGVKYGATALGTALAGPAGGGGIAGADSAAGAATLYSVGGNAVSQGFSESIEEGLKRNQQVRLSLINQAFAEEIEQMRRSAQTAGPMIYLYSDRDLDDWMVKNGQALLTSKNMKALVEAAQTEDQKTAVQHTVTRGVLSLVYQQGIELEKTSRITAKNAKDIKDLLLAQNDLKKAVVGLINAQASTAEAYEKMAAAMGKMSPDQAGVSNEVMAIKGMLYSKEPASRQIDAIQRGEILFASEETKGAALKTLQQRKYVEEDVKKVADDLHQMASIAGNLGFPPNVTKAFSTAAAVTQSYQKFMGGLISGNPLAAVSAFTGLMGLGQKSADEAHFEAIMAQLDIIDQKLDKVLQNQQILFDALVKLESQIQKLDEKLDVIDQHIGEVKAVLDYMVNHDVHKCMKVDQKELVHASYKRRQLAMLNIAASVQDGGVLISNCLGGLEDVFSQTTDFPGKFLYGKSNDETPLLRLYKDQVGVFIRAYQLAYSDRSGEIAKKAFAAMPELGTFGSNFDFKGTPNGNVDSINRYVLRDNLVNAGSQKPVELLSADALKTYVDLALRDQFLYILVDRNSAGRWDMVSPETLINTNYKRTLDLKREHAVNLLKNALRDVNTAIAQRGLLAGDHLVYAIEKNFRENEGQHPNPIILGGVERAKLYDSWRLDLFAVFRRNRPLLQNFIYYHIVAQQLSGQSKMKYATILNRCDTAVMKQILSLPRDFNVEEIKEKVDGKETSYLAVTIDDGKGAGGKINVVLPSIAQLYPRYSLAEPSVTTATLLYADDVAGLISLKRALAGAILNYVPANWTAEAVLEAVKF